jgi:hypothetical protein
MLLQCELPASVPATQVASSAQGTSKFQPNTTSLTHTSLAVLSSTSPSSTPLSPLPFFASLSLVAALRRSRPGRSLAQSIATSHSFASHCKTCRYGNFTRLVQTASFPLAHSLASLHLSTRTKTRSHNLNSASILSRHRCIALPSFAERQHVFKGTGNSWVACWPCHQRRRQCGPHH